MVIDNELKAFFYKINNFKYLNCLEPNMQCNLRPIRAHSVQNSNVLDLLVDKGHVVMPRLKARGNKPPVIKWESVGRNLATTFTGLCQTHDCSLFAEIDQKPFDSTNEKQLFLHAYKAACKELHSVLEGASKIQSAYLKKVEKGLAPKDAPSESGLIATGWLMKAYETWSFRNEFYDEPLRKENFQTLKHEIISFKNQKPILAVCSLFSLDHIPFKSDVARIALNVFPISEAETVVLISYPEEYGGSINPDLQYILNGQEDLKKYELSKMILNNCDNFVLAPKHFSTWSVEKKKKIIEYFSETLFESNVDKNDHLFNLF